MGWLGENKRGREAGGGETVKEMETETLVERGRERVRVVAMNEQRVGRKELFSLWRKLCSALYCARVFPGDKEAACQCKR